MSGPGEQAYCTPTNQHHESVPGPVVVTVVASRLRPTGSSLEELPPTCPQLPDGLTALEAAVWLQGRAVEEGSQGRQGKGQGGSMGARAPAPGMLRLDLPCPSHGGWGGSVGVKVFGVFHPDRYLQKRPCVQQPGVSTLCSPSAFEKAGGGRGARWYRSIVVYDSRMTLGRWLTANGLGVRMGPQRPRGRKRPADGAPGGAGGGGQGGGRASDGEGSGDGSDSDHEDVGASGGASVDRGAECKADVQRSELVVQARKRLAVAGSRREGTEGGAEVDPGRQSGPPGLPKATDIAALLLAALPPATVAAAAAAVAAAVAGAAAQSGVGNAAGGAAAAASVAATAAGTRAGGVPRRVTCGGSAQPEGQLQDSASACGTATMPKSVPAARQQLKRRTSAPVPPLIRPHPPPPADTDLHTATRASVVQGGEAAPSPLVQPWGGGLELPGRDPHSLVLPTVPGVAADADGSGCGVMGVRASRGRRATEGGAGDGAYAAVAAVGGPGMGRLMPSDASWRRGGRAVGAMGQAAAAAGGAAAAAGSEAVAVGGAENGAAAGCSWQGLAVDGVEDRGRAILRARDMPLPLQQEQEQEQEQGQQQQQQRPPHVPEQRGSGSGAWGPPHGFALPSGRSGTLDPLPSTPFAARPGPAHGSTTPPAHNTVAEAGNAGPAAAATPAVPAKKVTSLQRLPSHLEPCEPGVCEVESPSSPIDCVLLPTRGSGASGVVRTSSDPQNSWGDPRVSPPASYSPRELTNPNSASPRTELATRHSRTTRAWPCSPTDRFWRPEHHPAYHHPVSHGVRMYRPAPQYGTWAGACTTGGYPGATPPPAAQYASVVHVPEPQPYHAAPPASLRPPPGPWRRPLQGPPPAPQRVVQMYPAVYSYGTGPDAEYRYRGQEQEPPRERAGASVYARGEVEGAAAAEAPGRPPVGHVPARTVTTGDVIVPLRLPKQQDQQESGSEVGCEEWARPLSRGTWDGAAGPYAGSSGARREQWLGRGAPKEQLHAGSGPVMVVLQPGRQATARGSSDASGRPRARPPPAPPRPAAAPRVVLYQPLPAVRSPFVVQSGAAGHVVHMVGVPAVPVVRDGGWVGQARSAEHAPAGRVRGGMLGVACDGRPSVRREAEGGVRGAEGEDAASGGVGGGGRESCDGVGGAEEGEGAGQRGPRAAGGLMPRGRWMARWTQQQGQQQQQAGDWEGSQGNR